MTHAGTFGVVYKATLLKKCSTGEQSVAVKMARSEFNTIPAGCIYVDYMWSIWWVLLYITHADLSSKLELRSLLNESLLMKRFDHPNIVGLLGVCFDTPDSYPYLVLPFMVNGNIRDYLKEKRVHQTDISVLPDVSL